MDELSGFMRYSFRREEYRDLPTTRYGMPSITHVKQVASADLIAPTKAVWQGILDKKNYPDGYAGLHAIRVLVAANISAEMEGRLIEVSQNEFIHRGFSWA